LAIQSAGTREVSGDRYTVEFEEDGSRQTFYGDHIVGAGFQSVTRNRLISGQMVFIMHNGREVEGSVESMDGGEMVSVALATDSGGGRLLVPVRVNDIRLMRSRRSARLSKKQPDSINVLSVESPFESSCKRLRPTEVASVSCRPNNRWYYEYTCSIFAFSALTQLFAPRLRQITPSAFQHLVFLPARCPSCHPTNSVKALMD